MRCFMRQVSWRSGKGYKQVDIMPIPTEGIHRGARGKRRHASSLVQQRLNGKHSRRYLVQLVNANFGAGDWLLTLTYARSICPPALRKPAAGWKISSTGCAPPASGLTCPRPPISG